MKNQLGMDTVVGANRSGYGKIQAGNGSWGKDSP